MMHEIGETAAPFAKRVALLALAGTVACSLSFPSLAFAAVRIDKTELAQGENEVGGGKATLADSSLDMNDVKANELYTDEDLSVNFNGGNEIEEVNVAGSAEVEMNFAGDNAVKDVTASENSDVTVNADGHNDFESVAAEDDSTVTVNATGENDIETIVANDNADVTINADDTSGIEEVHAGGDSNVTINVTGENDFEEIAAIENADVTVRGTDCQQRDVVNLGDGESSTYMITEKGDLTIDHATVNAESVVATIGSDEGDVKIDTSKVAKGDDNEYTEIYAGGKMDVRESVIDIKGTVHSKDKMTIDHSDMKVEEHDPKFGDPSPYRVYSDTGIELLNEKNGTVEEAEYYGKTVKYVDTEGDEGKEVDLKADGKPAYYRCADEKPALTRGIPQTGDETSPLLPMAVGAASAATAAYASRRRAEQ